MDELDEDIADEDAADEDVEEELPLMADDETDEFMTDELEPPFLSSVMKEELRVPRCGPICQRVRTVVSMSKRRLTGLTFAKRSTPWSPGTVVRAKAGGRNVAQAAMTAPRAMNFFMTKIEKGNNVREERSENLSACQSSVFFIVSPGCLCLNPGTP